MSQTAGPKTLDEIMTHWSKLYAFGLPAGSVRALLVIMVLGSAAALTALHPEAAIPDAFRDLLFLILGSYFAHRRGQSEEKQVGPNPLFLPTGTIRFLINLGFIAVVVVLLRRKEPFNPEATPAVYPLMIVAGFLIGVMSSRLAKVFWTRGRQPKRIWADIRAALTLLVAGFLVLLAWDQIFHFLPERRADGPRFPITDTGIRHFLAAVVAFYFGARS
jgi:hypothetical protein